MYVKVVASKTCDTFWDTVYIHYLWQKITEKVISKIIQGQ